MNKNVLFKNVLNEEDIVSLNKIVDDIINNSPEWIQDHPVDENGKLVIDGLMTILRKDLGRITIHNVPMPQNIIDKLNIIIKEAGFEGYYYQDSTSYFKYSSEHGMPKLRDHRDMSEDIDTLILDYQIDANIDWAISVEENKYILKNNEAVTFFGRQQEHGRPVKRFNEGDYVSNFLFRFSNKDLKALSMS